MGIICWGRDDTVFKIFNRNMAQLTYLEAIRQGIWEEMERDQQCSVWEDIGIYGARSKSLMALLIALGPSE
jgi:hypothetical protein